MPARAIMEGLVMTTETVSAAPAHLDGGEVHATRQRTTPVHPAPV